MSNVMLDRRIESSVNRLRAMGLKFYVDQSTENSAYLVIDIKSIIQLIDSKITYPSKKTTIEDGMMVIHFWRGGEKADGKYSTGHPTFT